MKRSTLAIIAAVVIIVVAVGAYYATSRPRVREFTLRGGDFFFLDVSGARNPELTVRVGDTVKVTLQNQGGVDHEFMILTQSHYNTYVNAWKAGMKPSEHPMVAFKEAEIKDVEPGQTKSTTFVADKAGTYVYACLEHEPDLHAVLGMFGTFTVASGSAYAIGWLETLPYSSFVSAVTIPPLQVTTAKGRL